MTVSVAAACAASLWLESAARALYATEDALQILWRLASRSAVFLCPHAGARPARRDTYARGHHRATPAPLSPSVHGRITSARKQVGLSLSLALPIAELRIACRGRAAPYDRLAGLVAAGRLAKAPDGYRLAGFWSRFLVGRCGSLHGLDRRSGAWWCSATRDVTGRSARRGDGGWPLTTRHAYQVGGVLIQMAIDSPSLAFRTL